MDIIPIEAALTEEEQEVADFEEKLERGAVLRSAAPVRYYFDQHPEIFFDKDVLDYMIENFNVRTIGDLFEMYEDVLPQLIEVFPHIDNAEFRERMDQTLNQIHEDAYMPDAITIHIGR